MMDHLLLLAMNIRHYKSQQKSIVEEMLLRDHCEKTKLSLAAIWGLIRNPFFN